MSAGRPPGAGETRRRILYVVNDLATGGAQRVLLRQVSSLDRDRFATQVASLELIPGELGPEFEARGVPVHTLGRRRSASLTWRLPRLMATLRPEIVHTHLAASGVAGRLAARRVGVPIVVSTLHNLSDWREKRTHPLRWVDRATLPLADAVVAVSEAVRRAAAQALPALEPRLCVIPGGVPLEDLAGARGERMLRRAERGVPEDAFVVGSVARLEPRKGVDTLIDAVALAAAELPRLRLVLVGEGSEFESLARRAHARGVADRVTFVPKASSVREWLATFDVFAAPSRSEGLGVAAIEALAAGVPVLASRVGGLPEVVADGVCGLLLPPDRPEAWAQSIESCASGAAPLDRWAAAAPTHAARFSNAAGVRALELLYDKLGGLAGAEPRREAA